MNIFSGALMSRRCGNCTHWDAELIEGADLKWADCKKFKRDMSSHGHCAGWEKKEIKQ